MLLVYFGRTMAHRQGVLSQAPKLPVRENDAGQIFVANLSSLPISTEQEFQHIYSCVGFMFLKPWLNNRVPPKIQ
jgi:hypothetical protein